MRFAVVGSANTIIDFGILFALNAAGIPVIAANIASTSTAFCFSFFANKKYTFQSRSGNIKREITLFIVVTLFGLWVIQTAVIELAKVPLAHTALSDDVTLFIAKLCATAVSLIWNYTLYSRFVFRKEEK